ncbi:GTP cyclohydrolase I FolE [Melittangium boletus]|uniref:GTP cyclohydrolase 1 n=1 Tax=Melittangium boletus DSM 14713 TaxID=1294270 RepID=A0A250ID19_9BACT|nr:GTP cyclohydrolase I FolE [Melittangium boletus]ATB29017.1 GTP cyclohydrolase I [Melittangium boletus DSM 14713]
MSSLRLQPVSSETTTDDAAEPVSADDLRFEKNIEEILGLVGEDTSREGLLETPRRVRKAWREWTEGYAMEPNRVLKSFVDGASDRDEMVLVRDIPVYSHCEHHLAPFFGVAHVCYIPTGRIVGLSKLPRLVDIFSRRLQVQERLTQQIAQALDDCLSPQGVGVIVQCRHLCMESRGIRSRKAETTTAAYRGLLKTDLSMRAEFMERTR